MRTKADLRAAQQRTATYLYENDAVQAVLPMGAGKTAAALTAITEMIDDGVIRCALGLAPKRVAQLVWPKEPKLWEHLQHLKVSVVAGTPQQRHAALFDVDADIYMVGVDNAQWLVEVLEKLPEHHKLFDLLLIDELSRFKNPRGERAKALRKIIKRWNTRWGLTGTPRPNGWEDQFMPMTLLTQMAIWGKSFDKWRDERFMQTDYHGHQFALRPEWRDRTIADISRYSITISEEDMPDLPPLTPVFHWVTLPPAARKAYQDMEHKLFARYDRNPAILAANKAVATGKLAQIANGFMYDEAGAVQHVHTEKADQLVELFEELDGDPGLVAYEFFEDLTVIKELYPGIPHLGRGTTDKQAEQYEREWNERRIEKLALHPASAGHGLNLQYGGAQLIWYGLTWSAELYDQTLKRFHRPGQNRRCFAHHILARDTVDEIKYDRVIMKMSEQEAFRKYLRKV